MISPVLPEINDDKIENLANSKSKKKTNLKKNLSKEMILSSDDSAVKLNPVQTNKFYVQTDHGMSVFKKRIINNDNLDSSGISNGKDRKIKFKQTQVHLVDNWKEHNKSITYCCFWR